MQKHDVDYILIGGMAVSLYDLTRFTEDLDIFVKRDKPNIEKLQEALFSLYKDKSVFDISLEELSKYPVIRYGTPDNFYLDIVDRLGEAIKYDDLEYQIMEAHGIKIPLATLETLIRLKQHTYSPKDKSDIIILTDKLRKKK